MEDTNRVVLKVSQECGSTLNIILRLSESKKTFRRPKNNQEDGRNAVPHGKHVDCSDAIRTQYCIGLRVVPTGH
jgi:hypothetical protein